jgi:SulP family sulfate permease
MPFLFYAITLTIGVSLEDLREAGWVFKVDGVDSNWYEFWTLFGAFVVFSFPPVNLRREQRIMPLRILRYFYTDFGKTDWTAIIDTMPTQFALVFFGLLHVPINVPALAISIGEDNVDTNRELIAHGVSNLLAGMLGSCPNYVGPFFNLFVCLSIQAQQLTG